MVGTAQPLCLSASGTERRRYDSTMNLRKRKTHSVSSHYWGWTARPFPCVCRRRGGFCLDIPFYRTSLQTLAEISFQTVRKFMMKKVL